jgi:hypothetical protein
VFTLHGSDPRCLEQLITIPSSGTPVLKKIIIAADAKKSILKQLLIAGVGSSSLFPDLDGLCREIQFRYSNEYMTEAQKKESGAQKKESGPIRPGKPEKATVTIHHIPVPSVFALPLSQELPSAQLAPIAGTLEPGPPVEVVQTSRLRRMVFRLKGVLGKKD